MPQGSLECTDVEVCHQSPIMFSYSISLSFSISSARGRNYCILCFYFLGFLLAHISPCSDEVCLAFQMPGSLKLRSYSDRERREKERERETYRLRLHRECSYNTLASRHSSIASSVDDRANVHDFHRALVWDK